MNASRDREVGKGRLAEGWGRKEGESEVAEALIKVTANVHPECKQQMLELAAHLSKERGRIVSESTVLEMAVELFYEGTIAL